MLLKFLSAIVYLPLIIICMIISQIYFERQWDSEATTKKSRSYIDIVIVVTYLLQELCLIQLATITIEDVAFSLVIPITMAFRQKHFIWWPLLAVTPLQVYSYAYLVHDITAAVWSLWVPVALFAVTFCWLLVHSKLTPAVRYTIAILVSSVIHLIETRLLHINMSWIHVLAIMLGSITVIGLELWRFHSEQASDQQMHDLVVESERDELTGLLNYRAFNQEISDLAKNDAIHSIIIGALDIDHFKHINDTFGHLNGNDILSNFSTTIKQEIHQTFPHHGYVYRFGGEEFTVVVSNHSIAEVQQSMNRLEMHFQKHPIITRDGYQVHISFSCSLTIPREGEELTTTLKRADKLLYHVKNHGRGWVMTNEEPAE